jgi:uncharacterized membrane protein YdfJ with MMPL/SSD domain/pimeloyl-ACP methyl ester carboxylesterase
MSRTNHRNRNLAARMGRWSAAHWKTATFGWLAFVVIAFGLSSIVGIKSPDPDATGPGQSGRMDRILDEGFKQPAGESVLIQSRSLRVSDPAFAAAIQDVVARISTVGAVQHVRRGEIAKDGHAALIDFEIRGDNTKAVDKIAPVLDRVAEAQQAHPQLFIGEFGEASAVEGTQTAFSDDLAKAGLLSLPITLLILLITFGALVAAGVPLLLGLTAVFATFGLLALPSHLLPIADEAPALILLIGLAVGVDYAMFYLKRERQERAAGRSERAALEAAAATSGRSVLISGLTVMAAMAGMFLTGDPTFASFGLATMVVVAIAVLGSLTLLPALLSRLGDKVDRLRVPFVGRLRRSDGESRIWGAIVDRVLARPLLSAVLAGGLLVGLASPALQLRLGMNGPDTLPKSLPVVQAYDRMQQAFPGAAIPATVVIKASNVNAPSVRTAVAELQRRAHASGRVHGQITVDVNRDATVANITVPIDGTGADSVSNAAVAALRSDVLPQTVGALPNTEAGVTGWTAQWKDVSDQTKSKLPLVVGFVLLLAFGLMLFAFRSLVIALTAIVLNLLSVAAAYGVIVLVFQHGVGKGLLGFTSTAGVDTFVPLLLFVILFGLSMDYHVFMLSRIRESHDNGASTEASIAHGIKSTAGVVTSAAVVMVSVFAIFGTLSMLFFKQFGVGLATAVLIDATIVRAVLLPATMKLLGDWNWYLPKWLEWLPRLDSYEPEVEAEPALVPTAAKPARAAKGKRLFTPSRIIGLLLIGLVVLGLGYLRFSPKANAVSVPDGAKSGDIVMKPCTYGTEDGGYKADCGTLVVPENRSDPQSRLIALPVKRIHSLSEHPAEPIFRLQGGPGITNMSFPEASRFAGRHDVVLVGYRGMDGSDVLDCPEVESEMKRSTDLLAEESFRERGDAFRACADRLTDEGFDLAGYSLPQRVDDLEAARRALGYERIDLVSESAGTRTAMIYGWRYPKSIHRSVMVGANPPGHFVWDAKTTDEQIRRYAALCGQDADCRRRTPNLAAALHSAFESIPERWWFLPIREGNVKAGAFFGLMEATTDGNGPLAAPWTIDMLLSTDRGDGSGAWFMSLMAQVAFPSEQRWGDVVAVARTDSAHARRVFASRSDQGSLIGVPGADLIWAGGELADAWPVTPDQSDYARVRDSNIDTLLVGGNLDVATPPQWATRDLLPHLPNGRQVVLGDLGHTGDFWSYQPTASTRLVNTFLESGRVDTSLYRHNSVDFTPVFSHGNVAKIVLGAMLGLAALTVLSLAWMARRVHSRGGYGRKASAVLRSVYPIVLGLGGWFLGVLVVLIAFPSVPLDDQLLGVLGVGVPIGLGVHLAWANGRTKLTGFALAMAGALGGAWLGLQTASDLVALLTAIFGATAGANLALIVLDMSRDRRGREHVVASPALTGETAVEAT